MKLRTKILTLATALITLAAALSGCGLLTQFDASSYVAGIIDATYKGNSEKYLETVADATEEEVQEFYMQNVEAEVAFFAENYLGLTHVSEENQATLIDFYKKVYQNAKYDVKEAVKSEDGYSVEVVVYPINLFEKCYDQMVSFNDSFFGEDNTSNLENLTEEEIQDQFLAGILEICLPYADNIEYDESRSVGVLIKKDPEDDLYYMNDDDMRRIDELVINYNF
jgi:hypothetical protein